LPQISINEIERKRIPFGEAVPEKWYWFSASKGDMLHSRVQETFPQSFVKIGLDLINTFFFFYGKFEKSLKKLHFIFYLTTNKHIEN